MEVAYMFMFAPAVVWVAVMAIKLYLYRNDPLRLVDLSRRHYRSVRFQRSVSSRALRLIKKAPSAPPLPYRDLPSPPINSHPRMMVIKAELDRAFARAGIISEGQ
jgi:hypothetical protein